MDRVTAVGGEGGWVREGEGSSQRARVPDPWTRATVRQWTQGRGNWVEVGKEGEGAHL